MKRPKLHGLKHVQLALADCQSAKKGYDAVAEGFKQAEAAHFTCLAWPGRLAGHPKTW